MENQRTHAGVISPMTISAAFSLLALVGVIGWKLEQNISYVQNVQESGSVVASAAASSGAGNASGNIGLIGTGNASSDSATSSNALIAQIGPSVVQALAADYYTLKQQGTYTDAAGTQIGTSLAPDVHAQITYPAYIASEIKTGSDTSYQGMLAYRAALQVSLKPLLNNTQYELTIYGEYLQTKDPTYLTQLQTASQNYLDAASATSKVVAPQDAVQIQLNILNSLQEFGTTLQTMVENANDPITSTVLLENYNQAQSDVLSSFNALTTYEQSKHE